MEAEAQMPVGTLEYLADHEFPVSAQRKIRSGPPIGMPDVFVPALWSAVGLLVSMLSLPLFSDALAEDGAFFLVTFLR
jgi:hypothetical protein